MSRRAKFGINPPLLLITIQLNPLNALGNSGWVIRGYRLRRIKSSVNFGSVAAKNIGYESVLSYDGSQEVWVKRDCSKLWFPGFHTDSFSAYSSQRAC